MSAFTGGRHAASGTGRALGVKAWTGLLAVCGSLITLSSFALAFGNNEAGTSGAAFLEIGPSARPVGMAEAFTAVADDINAVYWNPAGLSSLKVPEMTGTHLQYFQNIEYEFGAFAYPTESHGTWALSINDLHLDSIDRRTGDTDTNIGTFGAGEAAYVLSYGTLLTSKLSVGGSFKFIRETIDSAQANAYGGDGGVLYDTGWQDLKLGAVVQNVGTSIKFEDESDPLPLTYRFGASAPILNNRLLLSSDLIIPRDRTVALAMGGEYKYPLARGVTAALRTGYQTGNSVSGLSGVAAGGGLTVGRAAFDFAWVPFGDLGNTYRFSLTLKFGASEETPPALQRPAVKSTEPLSGDR